MIYEFVFLFTVVQIMNDNHLCFFRWAYIYTFRASLYCPMADKYYLRLEEPTWNACDYAFSFIFAASRLKRSTRIEHFLNHWYANRHTLNTT